MASRRPLGPFILYVDFERREDGGLRASCDKVPGFHLSGEDAAAVLADVEPALSAILTSTYGVPMRVERAQDAGAGQIPSAMPSSGPAGYVGLSAQA